MPIEELKRIIESKNIDQIITYAKHIESEEINEALELYEKYYEKELHVAKTIQNILLKAKIARMKNKIPNTGNYSYELEL